MLYRRKLGWTGSGGIVGEEKGRDGGVWQRMHKVEGHGSGWDKQKSKE